MNGAWSVPPGFDQEPGRRFREILEEAIRNGSIPSYVRDFVHDYGFEPEPPNPIQKARTQIRGIHRNCARIVGTDRDGWDQANPPFIELWFTDDFLYQLRHGKNTLLEQFAALNARYRFLEIQRLYTPDQPGITAFRFTPKR